jgi:predicted MFS family arabinose efflux permease
MTQNSGWKALFAIVLASVISEYSLLVMPFIVGAMIDAYHISEALAGRIVALQLAGMAVAAVGVSYLMSRLNRRKAIAFSALLIVAANIACAVGHSVILLAAARFTTGLAEGTLMGIAGAIAAGTARPEKTFSAVGLAVAVAASIALFATPYIVELGGRRGTFWFLALFAATVLPVISLIPHRISQTVPTFGDTVMKLNPLLALFAFAAFWAGCAGFWVYAERIGLHQGMTLTEIGFYLSIGQIAGIPGPMLVPYLARRLSLPLLFIMAIVIDLAAGLTFVFATTGWVYSLGAALLSFWAMFLTPCFRTLMAFIDRSGTVVAASVAFFTIGYGAAPLIVGFFLVPDQGYAPVAIICTIFFILSVISVIRPARKVTTALA